MKGRDMMMQAGGMRGKIIGYKTNKKINLRRLDYENQNNHVCHCNASDSG